MDTPSDHLAKEVPIGSSRRRFLKRTGAATAASLAIPAIAAPRSPSETVRLALIGCGGRGTGLATSFAGRDDVQITHVCDLLDSRLEGSARAIARHQHGKVPKKLKRVEDLLEAKDLDAVIVGTPDHWHTPLAIMACQAGKDVYVEKPFSHNMFEGRMLVKAARKHKRIVQVGTQNRSAPYNLAALEYIRSGKLGDIHLAKIYNLKAGGPYRLGNSQPQPAGFDWARWLGPAPERPYHSGIFHAGWHKFWDFSGGDLADCGIHQIDLACLLLGDPGMPLSVAATGGRLHFKDDDAEVPDTQVIQFEFPGMVVTVENTNYPRYMKKIVNRNVDVFPYWPHCATRIELYGSKEQMMIGRHGGGWQAFTTGGKVSAEMHGRHPDPSHQQNFIDSIKSREAPNSDVEILHASTALVHLGNIATRVGHAKLAFDAKTEQFAGEGSGPANKLLKRQNKNQYSVLADV